MEPEKNATSSQEKRPFLLAFHVVLAAALYAMIQAYSLLSAILLSFLLILLITLAVNPIIARLRTWTGGRKRATGIVLVGVLVLSALAVWATVLPLKQAVTSPSKKAPTYWERLQKPLIKMEQQAVISEVKLQEEVSAEIVRGTPEKQGAVALPDTVESPRVAETPPKSANGDRSIRSSLGEMVEGVFGQIKGAALNSTEMLIVLLTVFLESSSR